MNLYRIVFDGTPYFVEAKNFGEAIGLWHCHVREEWGKDYEGTEEPEEVQLIELQNQATVIRAENFTHDPSTHRVPGVWCSQCRAAIAPTPNGTTVHVGGCGKDCGPAQNVVTTAPVGAAGA